MHWRYLLAPPLLVGAPLFAACASSAGPEDPAQSRAAATLATGENAPATAPVDVPRDAVRATPNTCRYEATEHHACDHESDLRLSCGRIDHLPAACSAHGTGPDALTLVCCAP
jgi:hypothetical protein